MTRLFLYGFGDTLFENWNLIRARITAGDFEVAAIGDINPPAMSSFEGIPVVRPEAIGRFDWDYILILSDLAEERLRVYLNRDCGIPREELLSGRLLHVPGLTFEKYERLRQAKLSLFSNDCFAGIASRTLCLEHRSPFKNLWLTPKDYLAFLRDPTVYLSESPVLERWETGSGPTDLPRFPVLRLRDILLYCNHYDDAGKAIADWDRRRAKTDLHAACAVMISERRGRLEEAFYRLEGYRQLVFITAEPSEHPSTITVPARPGVVWQQDVHRIAFGRSPWQPLESLFPDH